MVKLRGLTKGLTTNDLASCGKGGEPLLMVKLRCLTEGLSTNGSTRSCGKEGYHVNGEAKGFAVGSLD